MNKKTVLAVGLCVVLLVCSVIYFRPLPLSSCIPENGSLLLHSNTFGVQNGKPYIHSEAYDHITEDQKEKIMELAQAYTCLLYTSPSPRDDALSRMPSSA